MCIYSENSFISSMQVSYSVCSEGASLQSAHCMIQSLVFMTPRAVMLAGPCSWLFVHVFPSLCHGISAFMIANAHRRPICKAEQMGT